MFIRGQSCSRTCKTPAYYDFSTANTESEVVSSGEMEDIFVYRADTQKMMKYEVSASTVTDMIHNYMTQTFYSIEYAEPTLQTTADGIVGMAPHLSNRLYANESLIYRLKESGKISNAKFAIWHAGGVGKL